MKKLRIFFVALLLSAVAVNSYAYTKDEYVTIGDYTIRVIEDSPTATTASLYGCSKSGEVILPGQIYDDKVTTFDIIEISGASTGSWNPGITSVEIPSSVKALTIYSFSGSSITNLHIPKTVETIGNGSPFSYKLDKLESFSVDEDSPYFEAYDDCLYRKNPKSLIRVPNAKEFADSTLTIQAGCVNLEAYCAGGNKSIKTIVIPSTVESIWKQVGQLPNLEAFDVDENNNFFSSYEGVLFNKDTTELIKYPYHKPGTNYTVHDSVKIVTSEAIVSFYMTNLVLNQVEKLEDHAIASCLKLTTLTIPACLTKIEGGVYSCRNISKYIVEDGNPHYFAGDDGVIYNTSKDTLLLYPPAREGAYVIPSGPDYPDYNVKVIGHSAFVYSQITELTIPQSVEEIDSSAFQSCLKLTKVQIPEDSQLKIIEAHSFQSCTSLTEINLPEGLLSINEYAFSYSALQDLRIPASVTNIKGSAFRNINTLESVVIADGSMLNEISGMAFQDCPNLESFDFEGTCKLSTIGPSCFLNDAKLESIALPASVSTIAANAFKDCKGLTTVTFADDAVISRLGYTAFADCGITSISLPQSIITIADETFRNCTALESVEIGAKANKISPTSFLYCENLAEIKVDHANKTYSSSDGILLSKDKETLIIFPEGKANENEKFTLLPPSLTSIGDRSFFSCKKLTNVCIPNKVTSIGERAFSLCSNLRTITFLCDEMIDPANINQETSHLSFDDGTAAPDMFGNITINVRKELLEQYQNNDFYKKFHAIQPSFVDESRAGGINQTKATEEFIAVSDSIVDLLSVATEDMTYVLPKTVTKGDKTYKVGLVGDYLFTALGSDVPNATEVIVPQEIEYIGARAFVTNNNLASLNSSVKSVFLISENLPKNLLSTVRFELTPEDLGSSAKRYDEFGEDAKIYVKESAEEAYKEAWANYADRISYKIPLPAMKSEYGSFSREFAVDLSAANPDLENPSVIAFTAGAPFYYPADNLATVRMVSINHVGDDPTGSSGEGDGTYIPANTGVLLRAYAGSTAAYDPNAEGDDKGVFYQIAESQAEGYEGDNLMACVTINSRTIEPTEDGMKNFYLSGGKLWSFTKPRTSTIHKSYLQMPEETVPEGANLVMLFDAAGDTDGITDVKALEDADGYIYNLQGQRVNKATKGIYIKNGKKYIKN